MFNRLIATLFIAAICLGSAVAQDDKESTGTGSPIEVKTDRFSNVTTVTLKPQAILDESGHLITMRIDTKLEKKNYDDVFRDEVKALVYLESHSQGGVDFGDYKIYLLINSKPLNVPPGEIKIGGLLKPKSGFKVYRSGVVLFNRETLERIRKADRIEMRIGSIELTLSASTLATLREYATQALAQQKAINGR